MTWVRALHLVPIGNLLEVKRLHGSSGDNHAVELLVLHHFKVAVEHHHVLNGRVLGRMALELHETHFNLQRGVRQQPNQVSLGGYLERHQIENHNFQRTDILHVGTRIVHHEDVLLLQQLNGGKFIG